MSPYFRFGSPPPPRALLADTEHRQWDMPRALWVMTQSWHHLLFAHWRVSSAVLRPLIPAGLALDVYDEQAWVGVVPFYISHVRPRGLPRIPGASAFPELNVRTYVTRDGKPGVWFFSLDAMHRLAVEGARTVYHLPYFMADMHITLERETVHYTSRRADARAGAGEFDARYRPTGAAYTSTEGSLDHWLTARYALYAESRGRLYRAEIHHPPWKLHAAEAEFTRNTVTEAHGIRLPDEPPLLHYVQRQDVLTWLIERI